MQKIIEKIPNPCDTREHYQSFIRKKNTKSVKLSEIVTYQPETFGNPTIDDIKSVIKNYPKPSHKLPKTIRHAVTKKRNN